jgi:hypothetical protein
MVLLNPEEGRFVGPTSNTVSEGTANYHGMLLSVRRRAASGVNINTNYTWSHCIGPMHGNGFGGTGFDPDTVYLDPNDRERTYGNCSQDRRHNFNFTVVARSPEFQNRTVQILASDWQLSTIYRVNSGTYLTIENGLTDRALNGANPGNQVADYLGGLPLTGESGPDAQNLNLDAFGFAPLGTLGNLGVNNVRGPAQWAFDVGLSRTFSVTESQRLEFRAEAYNVTNSFRAGNPNLNANNRFFGVTRGIDSADPRIMQFALKYVF